MITIYQCQYNSYYAYSKAYKAHNKKYAFKVKLEGGWGFFEYATDYHTWKNQK